MSPERLDPDQRLLYDALHEIWTKQARRVMLACALIASVATGITLGAVWGMRLSLRQTASVIKSLEERGELDRELVLHAAHEQQRANLERVALETQLAKLKRQVAKNAAAVLPERSANNATERGISNRRYEKRKKR